MGIHPTLAVFYVWSAFWPHATADAMFADGFSIIARRCVHRAGEHNTGIVSGVGMCALLGLAYSYFM